MNHNSFASELIKCQLRFCTCIDYVRTFSGGTLVTVYGRDLDSVAEARITLTVIITRFDYFNATPSYGRSRLKV